jgi:transposase
LQNRYGELFGETFDFLFYDITSTYFEGSALGNPQAKRGYSRDSRPDCPQVCIGLVTSREGLPLAFEVFDGNRTDVTTTEEMVLIMESKYGKANRIWVMDRGMVSEENPESVRDRSVAPDILSARRSPCSESLNKRFLKKTGKKFIPVLK